MPYLKIQTNQVVTPNQAQALINKASKLVASELGKPENYVMVRTLLLMGSYKHTPLH